jgi:hypothetical protein
MINKYYFILPLDGDSQNYIEQSSFEVSYWCKLNCISKYEIRFSYKDGNPSLYVTLHEKNDAMLFKLTWE